MAALCQSLLAGLTPAWRERLDADLLHAAALLHDAARCQPRHPQAAAVLEAAGFPVAAELIACHHQLAAGDLQELSEAGILFYADKLISGQRRVSLEERFAESLPKCRDAAARQAHQLRFDQALRLRELLQAAGEEAGDESGEQAGEGSQE